MLQGLIVLVIIIKNNYIYTGMKSSLEILEFNELKKIIEKHIQTEYGRKALFELKPVFDIEKAKKDFQRLNEFFNFFYKHGSIVLDDIYISNTIKEIFTGILTEKEILQIGNFLNMIREIDAYFSEHQSDLCKKYILFDIPFDLIEEINNTIDEHGFIKDSATSYLYELRTQIKQIKEDITRSLKNIMHSKAREIISDTAIFMKRSRYTILVKPNFKEYINGRIIDMAKSGGFFVEPDNIYSVNNKLEEIVLKEEAEKRRILTKITNMVRKNSSRLMYNEKRLGKLDLEIAKFEYAKDSEQPEITFSDKPILLVKGAKHPVLANIKEDVKSVDIDLKNSSNLIITGPNTGGKTVFLKTAGLIVLSVFSNIPPIALKIEMGKFDSVFAIIGDEQNIMESLSGFSAKMISFKNVYENLDENSLVLLDEIGGGTSPDEGEAVAFSIIENLKNKCSFIATTHYKRLAYILSSKGYPTAAFEFDEKNLKPTYRLKYGQIGQSYATKILQTLKLDKKITDTAIEFYKNNETNFSKLEKELEKKLKELDREKRELEKLKKSYEESIKKAEEEKSASLKKLTDEMNHKKQIYEGLINRLKAEINTLLKEKNVSETHKALSRINKEAKILLNREKKPQKTETFRIGDEVIFRGMDGKIIDIKGNKAVVEVNSKAIKTEISLLNKKNSKKQEKLAFIKSPVSSSSLEINLIGKRRDDAEVELVKFLDSAITGSFKTLRIIHGIGSGILKSMVHETLKNHPYIKSFHTAHPNEGGDGATIAEFK